MMTVQLSCPHCQQLLRCNRLIAPNEHLKCPHCLIRFRAGDNPDKMPERPTPHRASSIRWLLIANLLVLLGGSFAVAWAFHRRSLLENQASSAANFNPLSISEEPEASTPLPPPRHNLDTHVDPLPSPPLDIPPPPLPEPPARRAKSPTPAKEKPTKSEKPRVSSEPRPENPPTLWLPPPVQRHVDNSIEGGIEYLRREQHADGSWGSQSRKAGKRFTPGITALCGLTLLECGVPGNDGQIRSAARYLRLHMSELTTTYSISLALLFFDRLNAHEDVTRIRTLALRLLAGQKTSGGWDYYCPILNEEEELGLLALLYKDRPTKPLDLFSLDATGKIEQDLYRPRPSKIPPLELFIARDNSDSSPSSPKQDDPPVEKEKPKPKDESRKLPGDNRLLSQRAEAAAEKLSDSLKNTPALRAADLMQKPPDLTALRTDNSNTQFAILGLLIAENYDVPMERAMSLLDWRFRNSMTLQNGWNYRPNWQTTPSMTAAALMGLALKHGLLLPNRNERGRNVVVHDDAILHRGFLTLKDLLENYYAGFALNQIRLDKLDLYCLWTVERVCVLYNLRTLDTLDWYSSGVQLLLPLQREDGSWSPKGTTCLEEPPVATAFALLFLKRSNLARDLSERLNVPARK
jgi:hypothetical protein